MTTVQDHATPTAEAAGPVRHLLVWDAPNIDMALASLLRCKPEAATRPSYGALARWLCEQAPPGDAVEACVFVNVPPDAVERMRYWIDSLRRRGFGVFARPKLSPNDDIDDDIVAHIRSRQAEGPLGEVIVASHDFAAFEGLLRELAARGTKATVLGFREFAGRALRSPDLHFVDLEDIPDVFAVDLPRDDLANLPPAGRWLPPTVPLTPTGSDLAKVATALRAVVTEEDEPVLLATIGSRLRIAIPGFDHRSFDYSSLRALIDDIAHDAGVEVTAVGDNVGVQVTRPSG
jgi:uncharacterized protein